MPSDIRLMRSPFVAIVDSPFDNRPSPSSNRRESIPTCLPKSQSETSPASLHPPVYQRCLHYIHLLPTASKFFWPRSHNKGTRQQDRPDQERMP